MATIRTAIELQDNFTSVLYQVVDSVNLGLSAMDDLRQSMNAPVDSDVFDTARKSINQAAIALQELEQSVGNTRNHIHNNRTEQERFNQEIERGTYQADRLMGGIKRMVAAYAGIQTIGKVIDLSDQITSTTARLNLVVEDGGSVAELEAKIMASAERARAPYLDTASAIAKMGSNARSAFSGNDELIAFMEQVNKQFVIGGASAQEQQYAMVQLTQAMAAGTLRGEELNSILEQAPGIARAIEQYMGAAEGSIKSYAEQGLITSEVVKNALFAAAEQTNAKFESMPKTFAQIWTSIENQALMAFQPILQRINEIANSERFQQFVSNAVALIQRVASVASGIFEIFMSVVNAIADHWDIIEPILIGVAAGLVAMKIATLAQAAATWVATTAQTGLNLAMLACPATWIAIAIAAVVAVVLWLAKAVGGLDVLWQYAWASMQVAFFYARAAIESGFWWMVYGLMWAGDKLITFWEEVKMAAYRIFNAIADFFGQVGASILLGLEAVVNGAIDVLNFFIEGINGLGGWLGIDIQTIGHTDFGTKAQQEADTAAKIRAASYQQYAAEIAADRQARQNSLADMANRAESAWNDNTEKATAAWQKAVDYDNQKKAEQLMESVMGGAEAALGLSFVNDGYGSTAQYLSDINDNTKGIADSMEISSEDLKYLRDIAERDVINRFTTAEIKVEMTNHNTITDNRDLDGMFDYMGEKLEETLVSTAEGVHV